MIEDGRETVFGSGAPQATVHVHSPRAWPQLARGSRGMGSSYAEGLWDTPDLTAVIRVAARNVQHIDEVRRRSHFVREPFQRARAAFMRNTPQRARKDIAAHYDLGNELFALMLDPTLMYSCGVFEHRDATLEEASIAKLELVCEKLDLGPRDHVVEIGTGWGGFAVYAATTRGCRVTTTTISREQHDVAARRVKRGGRRAPRRPPARRLPRPARHLRQARLAGDDRGGRLAGLRHLLRALLGAAGAERDDAAAGDHDGRPRLSGREGLQELHPHLRLPRRLPALARGDLAAASPSAPTCARSTSQDLTPHYAETLRRWRTNFEAATEQLEDLGYDERFRRLWRMYLSYCEAGFAEHRIGLVQTVLAKPLAGLDLLAVAPAPAMSAAAG